MKYLKIQNNGELDIRLVALMGGTTKANDKYKIGQFGTGLKYTLAYLFRNNIDFKIFTSDLLVDVNTEVEDINGTAFDIICINGKRTSITAGMGNQWSAWMIIRELWCNALDEGGELKDVVYKDEDIVGEDNKTTFFIQITPEIQAVLDNWQKYFIQEFDPLWENQDYAIYHNDRKENLCLYKNGVLIYQHPNVISLFSYDIKDAEINELREFKGMLSYSVLKALECPNSAVITYFLRNVKEEHYEGSELDYDWFVRFADVWRDAIGNNKLVGTGSFIEYESRGVDVDYSNVIELPKKVYASLTKQFEGVGALARADNNEDFYDVKLPELERRVTDVINLLSTNGYNLNPICNIRYGFFQKPHIKVSANRNRNWLMISDICKGLSDSDLSALIIEHNEYLSIKVSKDSADYAKHFIKLYTNSIIPEVANHTLQLKDALS